jgi:SPP1 gp7 family putative phage head morphogenesis protein
MINLFKEIAGIKSDPFFWSAYLEQLPNPDPILKKAGIEQEIYRDITYDPHVLGELRSIRSGLLSFEQQLQPGGDKRADRQALELCQKILKTPLSGNKWPDITWQFAESIFYGYRLHEICWEKSDHFIVPKNIKDVPNNRTIFDVENEPRLLTKKEPIKGEKLAQYAYKFILNRFMPDTENPYGFALLSACYWPYIFKHAGTKFFVKFIERFGNPLVVGHYSAGTGEEEQETLATKLAEMIENSVAVISEESKVSILEVDGRGESHEKFLNFLNRELSKALTSQTLATEIQGQGSRAASETHRGREQSVSESDRTLVESAYNELLKFITELNYPTASPPTYHFFEENEARLGWSALFKEQKEVIGKTIPVAFVHKQLNIPMPKEGEKKPETPENMLEHATNQASDLEKLSQYGSLDFAKTLPMNLIHEALNQSKDLESFNEHLMELYTDKKKQHSKITDMFILSNLFGYSEVQDEQDKKGKHFASNEVEIGDLPFKEAIDFFREKIDIPTDAWYDLQRQQHDLAFVIAGATQADLLNDMHLALLKALETGTTLNDFRKNFDQIVGNYGWSYKGGRNWRTAVIFDTNMHASRAAAKWEQYQRVKEERPFLRYVAVRDHRTRNDHAMLHGIIRPLNDDFWGFYFPPLGYRCRCTTISYSEQQLKNQKITDSRQVEETLRRIGSRWVTDPRTGEKKVLGNALTLGFDYHPGKYKAHLKQQILNKSEHYFPELKKQFLAEMDTKILKL